METAPKDNHTNERVCRLGGACHGVGHNDTCDCTSTVQPYCTDMYSRTVQISAVCTDVQQFICQSIQATDILCFVLSPVVKSLTW